eukprot:793195_1
MTINKITIGVIILIITMLSIYLLIQHKKQQIQNIHYEQQLLLKNLFLIPLDNTYWLEAGKILKKSQNEINTFNLIIQITKSKYQVWVSELTTSFGFNAKNSIKIRKKLDQQWRQKFDIIKHDVIFSNFYQSTLEEFNVLITDITAHIQNQCQNINNIIQSTGAFKIPAKTNDFISIIEFRNTIAIASTYVENLDDLIFVNNFGINLKNYKYRTLQKLQKIKY